MENGRQEARPNHGTTTASCVLKDTGTGACERPTHEHAQKTQTQTICYAIAPHQPRQIATVCMHAVPTHQHQCETKRKNTSTTICHVKLHSISPDEAQSRHAVRCIIQCRVKLKFLVFGGIKAFYQATLDQMIVCRSQQSHGVVIKDSSGTAKNCGRDGARTDAGWAKGRKIKEDK